LSLKNGIMTTLIFEVLLPDLSKSASDIVGGGLLKEMIPERLAGKFRR